MTPYQISSEVQDDLFEIWRRISRDSIELANRIEAEFYSLFESLGQMSGQGHARKDLTKRPVLFFLSTPFWSFTSQSYSQYESWRFCAASEM